MSPKPLDLVVIRKSYAVSAERVYAAWLDPALLSRFLLPAPGVVLQDVMLEAKVGGAFSWVMRIGETLIPIHGRFLELRPPKLLRLTWISDHAGQTSEVEIAIQGRAGGCELTLTHRGLPAGPPREDHRDGWRRIVDLLAKSLSAIPGKADGVQ